VTEDISFKFRPSKSDSKIWPLARRKYLTVLPSTPMVALYIASLLIGFIFSVAREEVGSGEEEVSESSVGRKLHCCRWSAKHCFGQKAQRFGLIFQKRKYCRQLKKAATKASTKAAIMKIFLADMNKI